MPPTAVRDRPGPNVGTEILFLFLQLKQASVHHTSRTVDSFLAMDSADFQQSENRTPATEHLRVSQISQRHVQTDTLHADSVTAVVQPPCSSLQP
ncbi:hypothetical protein CMQ_7195 [Grosmannia clavigera kw1407]|uniref:Uncharacterized protein n=1 Tax=Grosmannia clavigera (strain kw1407 / UAMH 11150) TaxID=655863 RepID=F0XP39_GROCL|nr:uncharacterized protein CMQ_7195 [Grosmannia clavigera kw1407]EFX00193.1 hypothetical protein CMQ_7195 [Grosmannia clavigera kw1407]